MDRPATCATCDRARESDECLFCKIVDNPNIPYAGDAQLTTALVDHACADSKLDPISTCAHCAKPVTAGVTLWTESSTTLSFCNTVHMLQHMRYAMTLLYAQLIEMSD